jgi:hypothetical protein
MKALESLKAMLLTYLVKKLLTSEQIKSYVRSALKVLGGFLIGYGYSTEVVDQAMLGLEPIVTGAVMIAVGYVLSFFEHKEK